MNDKIKENNKRTGLLALAADQQTPLSSCLNSEEMAALVEKTLSAEQIEVGLEHISSCEACYREWHFLSKLQLEQVALKKKSGILSFFKRSKGLAITGSTLAAAASLVIFLNIYRTDLEITKKDKETPLPAEVLQKEEHAAPLTKPAPAAVDPKKSHSTMSSERKESIKATKPQKSKGQATGGFSTVDADEESVDSATLMESRSMQDVAEPGRELIQEEKYHEELHLWREKLTDLCRKELYNPSEWNIIQTEATYLIQRLKSDPAFKDKHEHMLVSLKRLIDDISKENMTKQCREIFILLEEESGTR